MSAPNIGRLVLDHADDAAASAMNEITTLARDIALAALDYAEDIAHREVQVRFSAMRAGLINGGTK